MRLSNTADGWLQPAGTFRTIILPVGATLLVLAVAIVGGVITGTTASAVTLEVEGASSSASGILVGISDDVSLLFPLAFAFTAGTIEGWQQSGVVVGKQFVLAPDACPWCQSIAATFGDGSGSFSDNPTVPLDEPLMRMGGPDLVADFDGKTRSMAIDYADMNGPSVHPHCRCSLRAVLQETS